MSKLSRTQDLVADMMNLGEVLKRLCLVTADDVARAAAAQRQTKRKIGEELVAMGRLSPEDLKEALDLQARLKERSTSFVAMAELMEQAIERAARGPSRGAA